MATRAKFICTQVEPYYLGEKVGSEQIRLVTQYSNNPEDNQFAAATPSGSMEIVVSNPAVFGFFIPGKSYYIDITPSEWTYAPSLKAF